MVAIELVVLERTDFPVTVSVDLEPGSRDFTITNSIESERPGQEIDVLASLGSTVKLEQATNGRDALCRLDLSNERTTYHEGVRIHMPGKFWTKLQIAHACAKRAFAHFLPVHEGNWYKHTCRPPIRNPGRQRGSFRLFGRISVRESATAVERFQASLAFLFCKVFEESCSTFAL
ncbi:hypothetical protein M3J07_010323 [Ascochyta lentis]